MHPRAARHRARGRCGRVGAPAHSVQVPFVPFFIAAKLGSSAGMGPSTAFNRNGLQLPVSTQGLSAYCVWVTRCMQRWDVKRLVPAADRRALLTEARRLIKYTESFPYALKAQAARRSELHADLDKAMRRALAARGFSDPHVHRTYQAIFPNESAVALYQRRHTARFESERSQRTKAFAEGLKDR